MIDLKKVNEIRNVLNNKVVESIKDSLGNIIYEAWKELLISGIPPLTLNKSKGVDLVDYKIYGNSIQEGENLFNVADIGNIYVTETTTRYGIQFDNLSGNYKFSCIGSGGDIYYKTLKDGVYGSPLKVETGFAINIEQGTSLLIYATSMAVFNQYSDYKLIQTPTPDEPIEVESVGDRTKNLVNFSLNNLEYLPYSATGYRYGVDMGILPAGDYTISLDLVDENDMPNYIYVRKKDSSGSWYSVVSMITDNVNYKQYTFNTDGTYNYYIYIASASYDTLGKASPIWEKLKNIQLEKGNVKTDYEPYGYKIPVKVNDTITNIYLKEPLRKIGDYADYIDFENGKVVRNVFCRNFTGNESIAVPGTAITGYTPFRYVDTNPITYPFICNYLPFWNIQYGNASGKECLTRISSSGKQMFFTISNDRIPLNDTTAFKNWLKELNSSDNPMKVYSCLTTPIKETIQLPNIPTHKGTTILEIDTEIQPSNMQVIYKGKE